MKSIYASALEKNFIQASKVDSTFSLLPKVLLLYDVHLIGSCHLLFSALMCRGFSEEYNLALVNISVNDLILILRNLKIFVEF